MLVGRGAAKLTWLMRKDRFAPTNTVLPHAVSREHAACECISLSHCFTLNRESIYSNGDDSGSSADQHRAQS